MKRFSALLSLWLLAITGLHAQWVTESYSLASGWNAIWLAGDASHAPLETLVTDPAIVEIWRWNPNPNQIQFSQSPSEPSSSSSEWTVWKRDDPAEQQLSRLVANSAYLVRTTTSTTLSLKQLVRPPSATWLISGANFIGFPAASPGSVLSSYFASFIANGTTGLPATTRVYKYVGGNLGPSNPQQVNLNAERVRPGAAYWFDLSAVSDFTGPLSYEVPNNDGLAFGRTVSVITVGASNRTSVARTVTISLEPSEVEPVGLAKVFGGVPIARRTFDSETNAYVFTPVPESVAGAQAMTVTIPANGRVDLDFALDHTLLAGDSDAFYASILRLSDSGNFTSVRLPVSAEPASAAGLWLCEVSVSQVSNNVDTTPGSSAVSRSFALQYLVHLDADQQARLLRQAFVGQLTSAGNPMGVAVIESRVLGFADATVSPLRFYAPIMPVDATDPVAAGTFASGAAVTFAILHGYTDAANPFVHTYHPDHDNRDAKYSPSTLPEGEESYSITRTVTFEFSAEPPDGSTVLGWGTTILGGTYTETLTELNARPIQVSGTFSMRRISEIAEIDTSTTPPDL
jgi:hypothetical protein